MPASPTSTVVRELPRGGVVVNTSAGPIQFGCPPETIKDHMALELTVPTHYVVPRERFDRVRGVNVSEVEFPAYYNFFILKRTVNLITDRDGEQRLRRILTETLFGPQGHYAGDAEIGLIQEDSALLATLRRFLTNLIPQSFAYQVHGRPVGTVKQAFNPFVFKAQVDFSDDPGGRILDRRLALASVVLLLAIEGRQG